MSATQPQTSNIVKIKLLTSNFVNLECLLFWRGSLLPFPTSKKKAPWASAHTENFVLAETWNFSFCKICLTPGEKNLFWGGKEKASLKQSHNEDYDNIVCPV